MEEQPMQRHKDAAKDELPSYPLGDDIVKLILDRQRMAEQLVHLMKGEAWIVVTNPDRSLSGRWEKVGDAIMNEDGVRYFSSFIYSTMSPDKLTTNISEEEMNTMMREMMYTLTYVIEEKSAQFEIEAASRSYLLVQIEHFYQMALSASRRGTILNFLKPVLKREESYTPTGGPQKKGFLSHFRPTFLGGGNQQ